jgi:hypothetical protein
MQTPTIFLCRHIHHAIHSLYVGLDSAKASRRCLAYHLIIVTLPSLFPLFTFSATCHHSTRKHDYTGIFERRHTSRFCSGSHASGYLLYHYLLLVSSTNRNKVLDGYTWESLISFSSSWVADFILVGFPPNGTLMAPSLLGF